MSIRRFSLLLGAPLLLAANCDPVEPKPVDDTGPVLVDVDGDGYHEGDDCDDNDASIHPGAEESCDGLDNDCDGEIDEDVASVWYADGDGDGWGDEAMALTACEASSGYVAQAGDCDDAEASIHPEAEEVCNGVDDDCDALTDEDDPDLLDATTWYLDRDTDGYGLDDSSVVACEQPSGYAAEGGDCDDEDAAFHPGAPEEDCTDPADYNCDGSVGYADEDGDGWAACEECDDGDAAVHPDATELCDGIDNDCDTITDEDDAADAGTWYADADADGFGDPDRATPACEQPSAHVADDGDCDDADSAVNPDADELCDGIDNDCDGDTDEDDATDAGTWYADADADGYGDAASSTEACEQPSAHVADDGDCDDGDAAIHPAATELCNGTDDDCDGVVDEDEAADASTWYADGDADGYGDAGVTTVSCSQPSNTVSDDTDCDDGDPAVNPGATELCNGIDDDCDETIDENDATDAITWYRDTDGDGYGDPADTSVACYQPSDTVANSDDCDDGDSAVNPGATELCDGIDNDCDDSIDEDDATDASTWYADADSDGYGDADSTTAACAQPSNTVADNTDCDDGDASVNPAATELCDGIDNDCDGSTDEDEAADASIWYADADSDGYGDAASSTAACSQPSGHVGDHGDCDDGDAAVNPGATELCNGIDDDCDGATDEDDSADAATWYADGDLDGYGDAASTTTACSEPSGYLGDGSDCDDGDAAVNPGATELCNGIDDDCDGATDEDDSADAATWYADGDLDGYGDAASTTTACSEPSGYLGDGSDCDDGDAAVNPGATELCNGIDDDCDGAADEDEAADAATWYADGDLDGYGDAASSTAACAQPSGHVGDHSDCDDGDATVNPGATELCNGTDDDCDGTTDEDDAADAATWYADGDLDGYGDATSSTAACAQPSGHVGDHSDCDDGDAAVNPGATELCNGTDDDCDGLVDDEDGSLDTSSGATWYADGDADGYGDASASVEACAQPSGYVSDYSDCDDGEAGSNPGASELCDGLDNDCDGTVDERVCLDISNVDPSVLDQGEADLVVGTDATIHTETGEITGIRGAGTGLIDGIWFEVIAQGSGPDLGVFGVTGIDIASAATLWVEGDNALVIASSGDGDIAGVIDAVGEDGSDAYTTSGPNAGGVGVAAGAEGGDGSNNRYSGATDGAGDGAGFVGIPGIHYGNGGGGAGFCYGGGGGTGGSTSSSTDGTASAGGDGAGSSSEYGGDGGDGGDPYGDGGLEPLLAGSGGGGGLSDTDTNPNGGSGGGGAGGGAIQISVDGTLVVTGDIDASGGRGGDAWGGGGGGGSGGAVLLEALELDISGDIAAEGGRGGHGNLSWVPSGSNGGAGGSGTSPGGGGAGRESGGGGGGAGWILLRYLDAVNTGSAAISPDTSSSCASVEVM